MVEAYGGEFDACEMWPLAVGDRAPSGITKKLYACIMNRRTFLTAAATAAATGKAADKPIRDKPLKAGYWGYEFYDDKERAELLDVLETRSPFRWYGPGSPPKKVLSFEKE